MFFLYAKFVATVISDDEFKWTTIIRITQKPSNPLAHLDHKLTFKV